MKKAIYASDMLLKTEGIPFSWNSTDYNKIGLKTGETLISFYKLKEFQKISDLDTSKDLGLSGYNVFFNISSIYNYTNQINYLKGPSPSEPYLLIPVERVFLVENGTTNIPVKMEMVIWR